MPTSTPPGQKGAEDQALGRSRGGLSTKAHLAVRGLGCPVAFHLTGGHRGDVPQAAALIGGRRAEVVLADAAYDADHFRSLIAAMNAQAVIPNNPSHTAKHSFDRQLYGAYFRDTDGNKICVCCHDPVAELPPDLDSK